MLSTINHTKSLLMVGGGRWGKNLIRNFHSLGALHTICDVNPAILQEYASQYPEVLRASDYGKALENPAIDKVVIASPAIQHYSMAKQALLADKDLFVEKPLSLNCNEAEELVSLAAQRNRILMVGHLMQYHPCIIHLQTLVKQGALGKLCYIQSNRLNLGVVRTEENA